MRARTIEGKTLDYVVAYPDDFDPASESASTREDIAALNREMVAAGVRVFVGGLTPSARPSRCASSPTARCW